MKLYLAGPLFTTAERMSQGFDEFGFGPVTRAKLDGNFASLSCGENTQGHWWPFYDPLATTSYGLC